MKYMNARSGQRFLAYLVDVTLIGMVVNIIVSFIPAYTQNINLAAEYYEALLEGNIITPDYQMLASILKGAVIALGIMLAIEIPFHILYFIVLPYFWEKQTIGRLLMHVKVVTKSEEKPKISHLILREFVGGFIILRIFSVSVILPLVYWYLCSSTGRSLSDTIGGTRLVDTRFINVDFLHKEKEEMEKDYVDATFKDVTEENQNSSEEDEIDYKVF
ncbi:RDD family protein [bacterium]|nr:RDD family protein [bacterium]